MRRSMPAPRPVAAALPALILTTLVLLAGATDAAGDTGKTDQALPDRIEVEAGPLVLNGQALRKVALIKIYVAGLYLPGKEDDPAAILAADQPRSLMMHFLRNVDADRLCEGWDSSLEKNTPDPSEALKRQFATLCSFMEDAAPGERLVFQYLPGTGTSVNIDGAVKGPLPGKEFADALFRTWIGPQALPGEEFKKHLLGIL